VPAVSVVRATVTATGFRHAEPHICQMTAPPGPLSEALSRVRDGRVDLHAGFAAVHSH